MARNCRKLVHNLSENAYHLYELLKKKKKFVWLKECEDSFLQIKKELENAYHLYELLKKKKKFVWLKECEDSFLHIKKELENAEMLLHPNFEKSFITTTDASNKWIGFALSQEIDGELKTVLQGGRNLSKSEKNFCTTYKELLACYCAIKRCEFYLLSHHYIVYTDHQPSIHLRTYREIVNKRFRWIMYLESMNVKVIYMPGLRSF